MDNLDEHKKYTKNELFNLLKNPHDDWKIPDIPKEFAFCAGGDIYVERNNTMNNTVVDSCAVTRLSFKNTK